MLDCCGAGASRRIWVFHQPAIPYQKCHIKMENIPNCFWQYVEIFAADSNLSIWKKCQNRSAKQTEGLQVSAKANGLAVGCWHYKSWTPHLGFITTSHSCMLGMLFILHPKFDQNGVQKSSKIPERIMVIANCTHHWRYWIDMNWWAFCLHISMQHAAGRFFSTSASRKHENIRYI